MKIAIVDKVPSNIDYKKHFPIPDGATVNTYHLCSVKLPKVLKKDVDISINIDDYNYIILVGSEATKYFTKLTSVTNYCGHLVNEKFIPVINPSVVIFKPENLPLLEQAKNKMTSIFDGSNFTQEVKTHLIEEPKEALDYLTKIKGPVVALDCETSDLYPRNGVMLGISLADTPNEGAYITADALSDDVVEKLQEIVDNNTIVMHNSKFDKTWMRFHLGLTFKKPVEDTLLMHYALDETPGTHGLKQLALKYTNLGDYDAALEEFKTEYCRINKIKKEDFSYDLIPTEILAPYGAKDPVATFQLYEKFSPLIKKSKPLSNLYNNVLLPATAFVEQMEAFGVPFDINRLNKAQQYLDDELFRTKLEFYRLPEVEEYKNIYGTELNINSPIQLRKFFFDVLRLTKTGKKTGTGADSTDADVLAELAEQSPLPKMVLELRKQQKIKNTYIDKILIALDKDSRLRTGFNLTTTTSGRLSSSGKLNMQQLPRDNPIVKGCIKARPGYKIVSIDLGTAEMYYAAVLSKDPNLMKVFQNGGDFHSAVAKMVFSLPCTVDEVKIKNPGYRQAAKAISFGILYGSGKDKVATTVSDYYLEMHIEQGVKLQTFTIDEADDAIKRYFKTYSRLKEWLEETKAEIRENGYIYSHFGRKRRLKNVFSSDKATAASEVRSGVNFTIQSLASDINLLGAIDTQNSMGFPNPAIGGIFALVHDSILAEIKEEYVDLYCKIAKECIQQDRGVSIPNAPISLDIAIGDDYSFGKLEAKYPELC